MQGYITAIQPKQTSVGTMYDFLIDGRSIGAGKFPPKGVAAGDYVNYDVVEKGQYLNLKPGSMSKATPPAGVPAAAPAAAAPVASTGNASTAAYDAREAAHSRGAATNTAVAWFKILADAGALPIPKVAKDKQADVMYAMLKEYIGRFYKLTTGKEFVDTDDSTAGVLSDLESAEPAENWTE